MSPAIMLKPALRDKEELQVKAFPSANGFLCVHKSFPYNEQEGWKPRIGWKVSHVATGYAVHSIPIETKAKAVKVRDALAELGSAWDFAKLEDPKITECYAAVRDILRAHGVIKS